MASELKDLFKRGQHAPQVAGQSDSVSGEEKQKLLSPLEAEWKNKIHHALLKMMDLSLVGGFEDAEARRQIRDTC
ncbi:MAG: hypothetical protein ACO3IZ_09110, partial [Steroidobacteraceae bacterium]